MGKVKCVASKGYKVTEGQEYEILDETRDMYFLINDNGHRVRYAKELFETEEEVVPIPARTEQDMIDSITFNNNILSYTDLNNEVVNRTIRWESSDRAAISCGIGEKTGIDNILYIINDMLPEDDDYLELGKALLAEFITKTVINDTGRAMHLISTTTEQDEDMLSVLDDLAEVTTETLQNPNSGNRIRMWVFYTS